ncbi:hypothetical protein NDU88_007187 [Pleurodeles waltl]|uniref:Uncharacterized protein n=1 Tax=Pleurodeles waltl TaxID=8319 RepID=A0AAV7RSF0_PLEWA|nr:hypothetical protein NDU88_007187 [Pleurodeles waltl]
MGRNVPPSHGPTLPLRAMGPSALPTAPASPAPTRHGPSWAPVPQGGLHRAWEAEATCRCLPWWPLPWPLTSAARLRPPTPPRSSLRSLSLLGSEPSHRSPGHSTGRSPGPPRPPTASAARARTATQPCSLCRHAGRSSDRSAWPPRSSRAPRPSGTPSLVGAQDHYTAAEAWAAELTDTRLLTPPSWPRPPLIVI